MIGDDFTPRHPGYFASRVLPDGRVLDVVPLTFGRARLVISAHADAIVYDDAW